MSTPLPARIEDIPASLADVAEVFGVSVALRLIERFGGLDIKFPRDPAPDHPIIQALGNDDGRALCDFMGGMHVYIPHNRPGRTIRPEVMILIEQGLDDRAISRRLEISQRYVRMLRNERRDSRQMPLI